MTDESKKGGLGARFNKRTTNLSFAGTGTQTNEPEIPTPTKILSGNLKDKPIPWLLQAAAHYEVTGQLKVGELQQFAVVVQFGLGKPIHAFSPFNTGTEAIMELFTWQDGKVTFEEGIQPQAASVQDAAEQVLKMGYEYVENLEFLEQHAIGEYSILQRAPGRLSEEELMQKLCERPTYDIQLQRQVYGNIYGTLNIKDVAERMSLGQSQWVGIVSNLLKVGVLFTPDGRSLASSQQQSRAAAKDEIGGGSIFLDMDGPARRQPQEDLGLQWTPSDQGQWSAPGVPTAAGGWGTPPGQAPAAPQVIPGQAPGQPPMMPMPGQAPMPGQTPMPGQQAPMPGQAPVPAQAAMPAQLQMPGQSPMPVAMPPPGPNGIGQSSNNFPPPITTFGGPSMPVPGGPVESGVNPVMQSGANPVVQNGVNPALQSGVQPAMGEPAQGFPLSISARLTSDLVVLGVPGSETLWSESLSRECQTALTRPETGLLAGGAFQYMLEREFTRAFRFGNAFALLLFCIKHETAHMPAKALLSLSQTISTIKREVDIMGHFGDKCFGIILPDVDSARACFLVDRIITELPERSPELAEYSPAFYFGIASVPQDGTNLRSVVSNAQKAMFEAAHRNVARVQFVELTKQ